MDLIIKHTLIAGQEYEGEFDIGIRDGRIEAVVPAPSELESENAIDAGGCLTSMGFIDLHVHFDKCLTDDRLQMREGFALLRDRINHQREVKTTFTAEDVCDRVTRALKLAIQHGTTMVRTYVEADPVVETRVAEGVLEAKQHMSSRIDIQTCAFPQEGWLQGHFELESRPFIRDVLDMGVDLVGGNVNAAVWESDARQQVDDIFALAREYDVDIDMHLDNADNGVAFTTPYVLDKIEDYGWQGRVTGSHMVGISHVPDDLALRTIHRMRDDDMTVCVIPARIRLTRVDELLAEGVNVTCATDNMRDVFTGMGTADMLKALHLFARVTRRTRKEQLEEIWELGTSKPAKSAGLESDFGVAVDKRADLVVLDAKSRAEAIRNISQRRFVIKAGRIVAVDGQLVS